MQNALVNKVAQSGLLVLKPEELYPKAEIVDLDIKQFLFMEMVLREKEFRLALSDFNFQPLANKLVAVHCSTDAIVPTWAFMLLSTHLDQVTKTYVLAAPNEAPMAFFNQNIEQLELAPYKDQRVVIKGCGELNLPQGAYLRLTQKLLPVAKSIMFGEPCSTVPIFKKK